MADCLNENASPKNWKIDSHILEARKTVKNSKDFPQALPDDLATDEIAELAFKAGGKSRLKALYNNACRLYDAEHGFKIGPTA